MVSADSMRTKINSTSLFDISLTIYHWILDYRMAQTSKIDICLVKDTYQTYSYMIIYFDFLS